MTNVPLMCHYLSFAMRAMLVMVLTRVVRFSTLLHTGTLSCRSGQSRLHILSVSIHTRRKHISSEFMQGLCGSLVLVLLVQNVLVGTAKRQTFASRAAFNYNCTSSISPVTAQKAQHATMTLNGITHETTPWASSHTHWSWSWLTWLESQDLQVECKSGHANFITLRVSNYISQHTLVPNM